MVQKVVYLIMNNFKQQTPPEHFVTIMYSTAPSRPTYCRAPCSAPVKATPQERGGQVADLDRRGGRASAMASAPGGMSKLLSHQGEWTGVKMLARQSRV